MLEPKFTGPVKIGHHWPGIYHVAANPQYPWKYQCPQPLCFYVIVAPTEGVLIERIEGHTCPWFGGSTTTFSWGTMSDGYLRPAWALLDEQVDIIKGDNRNGNTDDEIRFEIQAARHRARGIAEVLALFMPPFFTTGDEIVREAVVRWERRKAGIDYETPGLGRFKYQQPPGVIGDPSNPSWATGRHEYARDVPITPATYNLSSEVIAKIKEAKTFPPAMLATAYGTTEAVVKAIQASA